MKNILIIVMDHVLFYKHDVFRPGYEYLKKKSICFANAYSVSPLCCPARRSILTGLYPHNHRQLDNGSKAPLNKETYYDALLKKGYKCEYYGKLHIGNGTIQDLKIDGFSMEGYGNPYKLKEYIEIEGIATYTYGIFADSVDTRYMIDYNSLTDNVLTFMDTFFS